eukprot:4053476-Pyramimonas_sp.AAC.1
MGLRSGGLFFGTLEGQGRGRGICGVGAAPQGHEASRDPCLPGLLSMPPPLQPPSLVRAHA